MDLDEKIRLRLRDWRRGKPPAPHPWSIINASCEDYDLRGPHAPQPSAPDAVDELIKLLGSLDIDEKRWREIIEEPYG